MRLILCLFNKSHLNFWGSISVFTKAAIDVVFFGVERIVPLPAVNKILTLLKRCALCDLEKTGWAGREGTLSPNSLCWKSCQDEKSHCSAQNKKIHHKTCCDGCCLSGIRQPSFMLQQRDSSKPIPISCFPTSKILTLVNAVLWPLSQPELFLLTLAEQHSLILPSASGSPSPSMGERSQCCMADKGHSTWFHQRSKTASRTAPPCKAACWSYSQAWQWGNGVTCLKTGRCLRSLWNKDLHKFHPVDIVAWLFSPSCRGEVTWSVLSEVTLVDTGGTMEFFIFSIPPIFSVPPISPSHLFLSFLPPLLRVSGRGAVAAPPCEYLWGSSSCWYN